jgi:streptogramin lyase
MAHTNRHQRCQPFGDSTFRASRLSIVPFMFTGTGKTKVAVLVLALLCLVFESQAQNIGLGTNTPHPSAQLDISSNNSGVLIPRMTASERQGIASPATGLLVYQTNGTPGFYYFDGIHWIGLPNGRIPDSTGSLPVGEVNQVRGTVSTLPTPLSGGLRGIVVDAGGNIYVANSSGHAILKMTPAGVVSVFAGSDAGASGFVNATGTAARFNNPLGLALDAAGNLYVADRFNYAIRKISPAGEVTTLAGSGVKGYLDATGTAAQFDIPTGLVLDASGTVYVTDHQRVRKISPAGQVTTLAGTGAPGFVNGQGNFAQFRNLGGIAIDANGNVYVGDHVNESIRRITPAGFVTTFAGSGSPGKADGIGTAAQFGAPLDLAIDPSGVLYVADVTNYRIRRVSPNGVVTTLAGSVEGLTDGVDTLAQFSDPRGIAFDAASGNLYVTEFDSGRIRKISLAVTGNARPLAGNQVLSLSGNTLSISGGNSVTLPCGQPGLPAGSVVFSDGSSLTQNNSNFFWDNGTQFLGIGNNTPAYRLDVSGRMRVRSGGSAAESAGIWFTNVANNSNRGFVGMLDDVTVGFFGANAGWQFRQNTNTGNASIGNGNPDNTAKLYVYGNAVATAGFSCASDARYKQNILPVSDALGTVLRLQGKTYRFNQKAFPDMGFDSTAQMGFLAQEVEKVLPQLVRTDSKGYKSVNYIQVIPLLTEAIRQQQQQLEMQQAEAQERLQRIAEMEKLVQQLLPAQKPRQKQKPAH